MKPESINYPGCTASHMYHDQSRSPLTPSRQADATLTAPPGGGAADLAPRPDEQRPACRRPEAVKRRRAADINGQMKKNSAAGSSIFALWEKASKAKKTNETATPNQTVVESSSSHDH